MEISVGGDHSMSDETLKIVTKPDPDNWDLFQSFFLEGESSAPPASATLDNWDVLESIFDLGNGNGRFPDSGDDRPAAPDGPAPPIPAPPVSDLLHFWLKWHRVLHNHHKNGTIPPDALDFWLGHFTYSLLTHFNPSLLPVREQIKTTLADADRAKRTAEVASFKARTAQRTAETATTKAQAAHQATETLKNQAEAANLRTQQTQQEAELAKTNIQAAYATVKTATNTIKTAEAETETAKVSAQRAYQATEAARTQAEEANHRTQQAQQAAEIAKKNAETAQKQIEDLLQKIADGTPPAPKPPLNPKLLTKFLTKHKFKFLFGAIALIPLLFLLSKLFPPKPTLPSIYINPITGNDANNGTAAAPFRTLSHALQYAGTGSRIYLAKGDYSTDRALTIPADTKLAIQSFNDIDSHWAAPFIRALAAQELIAGYPDGSFRPDANLTRAEYATLLTKVFNLPEAQSVQNFIDVSPDFWGFSSIQKAYSKGFLKGFPEGDFKPNDNVQRVQVIAALVSGLGLAPVNSGNPLSIYQDNSLIPSWAAAQVATATTENLIANYPNLQILNPTQSATRAETAVMMYQALVKQGKMPAIESPYLVKQ